MQFYGIKQGDLIAKIGGIKQGNVSDWMKGKHLPTSQTRVVICRLFEVDEDEMLNDKLEDDKMLHKSRPVALGGQHHPLQHDKVIPIHLARHDKLISLFNELLNSNDKEILGLFNWQLPILGDWLRRRKRKKKE